MYGHFERDDRYLSELEAMLESEYGLGFPTVTPAKRGFYGETWIVQTKSIRFFMKIDYSDYHKGIYKNSLRVVRRLCDHGLTHVSRVIPTGTGELSVDFNGGVAAVFEYLEGINTEDYPVTRLANALAPVYKVPADDLEIEIESFDTLCAAKVFSQIERLKSIDAPGCRALSHTFAQLRPFLVWRARRLELFAEKCRGGGGSFHITHGDAGGNAIILGDSFRIVDWDHPKLAPPERDAWFYLDRPEELAIFERVLNGRGVNCRFSAERLGYYSYYMFFYYMMENFYCLFSREDEESREKCADRMDEFFVGWTVPPLMAADEL